MSLSELFSQVGWVKQSEPIITMVCWVRSVSPKLHENATMDEFLQLTDRKGSFQHAKERYSTVFQVKNPTAKYYSARLAFPFS